MTSCAGIGTMCRTAATLLLLVLPGRSAPVASSPAPLQRVGAVQEVLLDGDDWTLTNANGSLAIHGAATVPSSVPDQLAAHGLVFDARGPRYGYENDRLLDLMTEDNFTFSLQFDATRIPPLPPGGGGRYELILGGVDTAAEIVLNGQRVGLVNDMHMPFAFDVTAALKHSGDTHGATTSGGAASGATNTTNHTLEVRLTNAVAYARGVASQPAFADPQCKKFPRTKWVDVFHHGTECSSYVRQFTGSFGWDCTRAWVAQGITRSVRLRAVPTVAVDSVVPRIALAPTGNDDFRDNHNHFQVELDVYLSVPPPPALPLSSPAATARGAVLEPGAARLLQFNVTSDWLNHTVTFYENVTADADAPLAPRKVYLQGGLCADNVGLWWPAAFGRNRQLLYNATVVVAEQVLPQQPGNDEASWTAVDQATITVGFRTFEYVGAVGNSSDGAPWPLFFKVNEKPLFAKGFNWMPVDVMPLPDDPDQTRRTRQLLEDAAAVGANTVRVWGGGLYESDAFYDKADELGLLVLQDGSFFGTYPDVDQFKELVRTEMAAVSRRLAQHPSLVMWSGNNESPVYGNEDLFVNTQLATVAAVNPNVFVYPSNPSNGWATMDPLTPRPRTTNLSVPHDQHYYGPCGTVPDGAMFASEFGWPSGPTLASYEAVIPDDQVYLGAPFHRWRSTVINSLWTTEAQPTHNSTLHALFPLLLNGTTDLGNGTVLGSRADLERWLYLTQALQSHCLGSTIETFRQNASVMGTLVWSLAEIWTAPAWSSIQHDGHWKMLHYHLRRLFEDVHVSFVRGSAVPAADANVTVVVDSHASVPVDVNCTLQAHRWSPGRDDVITFTAAIASVHLEPLQRTRWFSEPLASAFAHAGAVGCTANTCFFTAACDGAPTPVDACIGHRCDGTAACPCGCECGTLSDPGLCFVPQQQQQQQQQEGEEEEEEEEQEQQRRERRGCAHAGDSGLRGGHGSDDGIHTQASFVPAALRDAAMEIEPAMQAVAVCSPAGSEWGVTVRSATAVPHVFATSALGGVFADNDVFLVPGSTSTNGVRTGTNSTTAEATLTFTPRGDGPAPTCAEFARSVRVYAMSKQAPLTLA